MKKVILPLLMIALFSLLLVPPIQAQLPTNQIESLIVDLWPDYDQEKVLIMFTGALPADAPLPASITIPCQPRRKSTPSPASPATTAC
ncbi:MAG: hypothetical protein M5U34_07785 [Chloroflexi bacterium]|nr:hypothetical protein [Chloroflexota bacterium]